MDSPGSKGTSHHQRLRSSFPGSPTFAPELSKYTTITYQNILDGNSDNHKDLMHSKSVFAFDKIDMNYGDAPNYSDVVSGGPSGQPASPWLPNPSSSPTAEPQDLPAPPEYHKNKQPSHTTSPFVGPGTTLTPSDASFVISSQNLLRKLNFGKSGR